MQREAEITELLNEVLTAELTSVNQYFVDAKMIENWGYEPLAQHYRDESIDEMKDADAAWRVAGVGHVTVYDADSSTVYESGRGIPGLPA